MHLTRTAQASAARYARSTRAACAGCAPMTTWPFPARGSRGGEMTEKIPVLYLCLRCGNYFTVFQGDPEPDEDITICWDCVDALFEEGHEDP